MAEPNNERSSLDGQMRGNRKRAARSSGSTPLGLGSGSSSTNGVPCGACKYLRRKCVNGCIFAPHFGPEQGTTVFAAVHKIFGASNVSKLLVQLPLHHRYNAIQTLSYEAQARLADPVCGCVSVILDLYQQVVSLKTKLAIVHNLIAERVMAENTPQDPPQEPELLNNLEYSNGSSASNNMINMNMFGSNLHIPANDHHYVGHSQPIFDPLMYTGPYFKNEDYDVEKSGDPLVFADQMF